MSLVRTNCLETCIESSARRGSLLLRTLCPLPCCTHAQVGVPPFQGDTDTDILQAIVSQPLDFTAPHCAALPAGALEVLQVGGLGRKGKGGCALCDANGGLQPGGDAAAAAAAAVNVHVITGTASAAI